MASIPKSVFSTKDIAPSQRYEAFRESMGVVFEVSNPLRKGSEFTGELRSHLLGEILLADCEATGQTFQRTEKMIASDGIDHLIVQVFFEGYTRRQGSSAESVGSPGNVLIIDAAQPWEAKNSNFHNMSLVVPRRLISGELARENDHHGRVLGPDNPFGAILHNYIVSLAKTVEQLSARDIGGVSRLSVELLSMALNRATEGTSDHLSENKLDLVLLKGSIKQHLENNLHDPSLNVDSLAKQFGISRSHLYRVFDAEGGIANYLRNRRLDIAYKRIVSSALSGGSIVDIAFSVGYRNVAAFRRAFKQRFEMGPSEVIELELFKTTHQDFKDQRVWEQWFQAL